MNKVFVDASVLLASLRSSHGGSSELLRYAVMHAIEAAVSDDILDEVARHVHEVDPGLRSLLLKYLAAIPFTVIQVTSAEVQQIGSRSGIRHVGPHGPLCYHLFS